MPEALTTLKLVLTDHWFDEIKSGRKKYEYRKFSEYWQNRFRTVIKCADFNPDKVRVEFQRAYRKNPERMTFAVKDIRLLASGEKTDLKTTGAVFSIELGERLK